MALHLPIGSLKTHSGLEPVSRCEPSTYGPISQLHSHCAIGAGSSHVSQNLLDVILAIIDNWFPFSMLYVVCSPVV